MPCALLGEELGFEPLSDTALPWPRAPDERVVPFCAAALMHAPRALPVLCEQVFTASETLSPCETLPFLEDA